MANIFVSYKYGDTSVRPIIRIGDNTPTTARHYVDYLQSHLTVNDHINKGERDGESLAGFADETIASILRDKIYHSSVTVLLISKNMKDPLLPESEQWIPWEIAYSLREKTRNDRTSRTNAFVAVVLPDENGSYDYFTHTKECGMCTEWKHDSLFEILGKNMFNRKNKNLRVCSSGVCGTVHVGNDHSYIYPVIWDHFINNVDNHINHALGINGNINDYELVKKL